MLQGDTASCAAWGHMLLLQDTTPSVATEIVPNDTRDCIALQYKWCPLTSQEMVSRSTQDAIILQCR